MIMGIGVDMVSEARVARSIKRPGFLEKVYGPAERALLEGRGMRPQTAAANFAAKEAFGKALGTGLLRENLLNIVMLFPAGMLLPFVFGNRGKIRWWYGLLFGIFISGCIEGLQLILCRGLFEFDDMIHNSLGCMVGCAIGAGCLKKFNKK